MRKLRWISSLTWAFFLGLMIYSISTVSKESKRVLIKNIEVDPGHASGLYFVMEEDVMRLIRDEEDALINEPHQSLPLDRLERKLRSNPFVEEAAVYTSIHGKLSIKITQKSPLFRVINGRGTHFYVDRHGGKMPLSKHFSPRVPVASGFIAEGLEADTLSTPIGKRLFGTFARILEDPFWAAQTQQIYVESNGDLVLIPRVGMHRIVLGDDSRLDQKLANLMTLYRQSAGRINLNDYETINLKYANQIVCTKK